MQKYGKYSENLTLDKSFLDLTTDINDKYSVSHFFDVFLQVVKIQ